MNILYLICGSIMLIAVVYHARKIFLKLWDKHLEREHNRKVYNA